MNDTLKVQRIHFINRIPAWFSYYIYWTLSFFMSDLEMSLRSCCFPRQFRAKKELSIEWIAIKIEVASIEQVTFKTCALPIKGSNAQCCRVHYECLLLIKLKRFHRKRSVLAPVILFHAFISLVSLFIYWESLSCLMWFPTSDLLRISFRVQKRSCTYIKKSTFIFFGPFFFLETYFEPICLRLID